MYVIPAHIIIVNAFYATKSNFLRYEDIDNYKKLLYKEITKKYKYIVFTDDNENVINIDNHFFIKQDNGIYSFNKLDDAFIQKINSIYPDDIQSILISTNANFKTINNTNIKKDTNIQKKKGVLAN